MYEQFYHLREKPFNNSPDPAFFYPSPKHAEALNRLLYAIKERKGFVVITGEIGSGKTTICRALLNKLGEEMQVCLITNTHLNAKDLIMAILEDLRVEYKPGSKVKLLGVLNDYLIQQMQRDQNIVLIIDEAQNLTPSVLEEVRMLSNLETDTEKLIQIVLLGQPELRDKLRLSHLKQFKQRIALHYHIYPLTKDETYAYVYHRLGVVATNGTIQSLFSREALDVIYEFSQGIPRLINYACDNALLSGFVYEKTSIDKELVMEVIRESHLSGQDEGLSAGQKHCCPECGDFETCEVKWNRGLRGEEQVCCQKCVRFGACH